MKVAATSVLVFVLAITTFIEIVFSDTPSAVILRVSIFILVLVFGINLIRGVLREVEQREKIQLLAEELDTANKHQSELLYFITHQIKGFLTNTKGALSMILDGDYGEVPESINEVLKQTFKSESNGVEMVQGFLNASKIEQGTMQYDMKSVDLKDIISGILSEQKANLLAKNLKLETEFQNDGKFIVQADKAQLREAIFNLIDNSIKYTPSGVIKVSLEENNSNIVFKIKDTGVGITQEDMSKLFTKYGRGKDSRKVNVNSNGLGLYLVKRIIEDHKGKVWAESDGAGKGTTFFVQFGK